ncbi:hypothetical protein PPYR_00467 [Photinus pyralis]|uniref:Tr-type G domain-containing protein n=1 Tax=Photinus pyralis TaxID=7054 RepID=A0A5N4B1M0_PHOPY|nr:hypothetical protein PPYR_00467 [Photinus pyralis]
MICINSVAQLRIIKKFVFHTKNIALCKNHVLRILPSAGASYNSVCGLHSCPILLKRRKTMEERKLPKAYEVNQKSKGEIVDIWRNITMAELANVLQKDLDYVNDLFLGKVQGKHTPITDIKELHNAIRRSGRRMRIIGKVVETKEKTEEKDALPRPPAQKSELKPRPPIITVMGHVDHGKTTLLDSLRNSRVVDQEFGGITQHVGAFSVKLESGAEVTFLDTPGHAAFSAMRARGANLTDIIVLVVAADDGVMEQTVECIKMAKNAHVPILVAINKIDSPKADTENAEQMLLQHGIQVERLGGDIQAIHISALKKINLDQLTEALALQAELLEVGSDPTGPVEAVVVDSRIDPHRGRLCTMVVQRGTLKKGIVLVADTVMAKVRLMRDAQGHLLSEVKPGYPAEVEGWRELPSAGELVLQVESEKRAKAVIKFREDQKEMEKQEVDKVAILAKAEQHQLLYKERLELRRRSGRFRLRNQGPRKPESTPQDDTPTLHLLIKSDVDGTLEAILETLSTYNYPECQMDIVSYGVGAVTENDIELAATFKAIIYTFNVTCPPTLQQKAEAESVQIKHLNVIYKLVDTIKEDMNSTLPPKQVESLLGEAKVLQQFFINEGRKSVPIAGCRCEKGILKKSTLSSMRHLKNEVDVIKAGTECGLQFIDKSIIFEVGDVIKCYEYKMEPHIVQWDPGF